MNQNKGTSQNMKLTKKTLTQNAYAYTIHNLRAIKENHRF